MGVPVRQAQQPAESFLRREARLAYLGPEGTFTEQALRLLPESAGAGLLPVQSAAQGLTYIRSGVADAVMLPVHNTVAGLVPDTMRALVAAPSTAVLREVLLPVEFALLVRPGTTTASIRDVAGHTHALRQVRDWLNTRLPKARWQPVSSNAEGARRVRDGECDAAVAADFTAAHYGLRAAVTRIHDAPGGAVTRFLLCSPAYKGGAAPPTAQRTSLIGRISGRAGQLRSYVDALAMHPAMAQVSLYLTPYDDTSTVLFADCHGPIERPATARAVGELRLRLPGLRSLGSYVSLAPTPSYERNDMTHTDDIASLRRQIDALDSSLIDTLSKRMEVSRAIQSIRTGDGGSRVDPGRELRVRDRYAEAFGTGGTDMADVMLQICRGRS